MLFLIRIEEKGIDIRLYTMNFVCLYTTHFSGKTHPHTYQCLNKYYTVQMVQSLALL